MARLAAGLTIPQPDMIVAASGVTELAVRCGVENLVFWKLLILALGALPDVVIVELLVFSHVLLLSEVRAEQLDQLFPDFVELVFFCPGLIIEVVIDTGQVPLVRNLRELLAFHATSSLELTVGLEPTTCCLQGSCSTS